jgi:hypothetical protein
MTEPKRNTCPRCLASGCGACDDYPRCQEPVTLATDGGERSPVYIARPFGDGWELIGHADPIKWKPTSEERISAAARYMQERYAHAWSAVFSLAGAYEHDPEGILAMGYSREAKPELTEDRRCVSCGVPFHFCETCGRWWAGSHICEATDDPSR